MADVGAVGVGAEWAATRARAVMQIGGRGRARGAVMSGEAVTGLTRGVARPTCAVGIGRHADGARGDARAAMHEGRGARGHGGCRRANRGGVPSHGKGRRARVNGTCCERSSVAEAFRTPKTIDFSPIFASKNNAKNDRKVDVERMLVFVDFRQLSNASQATSNTFDVSRRVGL